MSIHKNINPKFLQKLKKPKREDKYNKIVEFTQRQMSFPKSIWPVLISGYFWLDNFANVLSLFSLVMDLKELQQMRGCTINKRI